MTYIKNGTAYPRAMRKAVITAIQSVTPKSIAQVAKDYNVSTSTVSRWKSSAGLNGPQPAGLAAHRKAAKAIKAFNTPTVSEYITENGDKATCIIYRGKKYI